jgi:uncharacterized metal-binding protein
MAECCEGKTKLIYSCSGAADVGEIADRVARKLRDEGFAKMSCFAGIGAELSGYVQSAKDADAVITVDGCRHACARKSLLRIGVDSVSFVLTAMGLAKGEMPVTEKIIADLSESIKSGAGEPVGSKPSEAGDCSCGGKC